jgi:hypothetical protein
MRLYFIPLLLVALGGMAAAPASAAPSRTFVGKGVAHSDGIRYVALTPGGAVAQPDATVVDTRSGSSSRLPQPEGCVQDAAHVTFVDAIGSGRVLWQCWDDTGGTFVPLPAEYSLSAKRFLDLGDVAALRTALVQANTWDYTGVGKWWIAVNLSGVDSKGRGKLYFNPGTSQRKFNDPLTDTQVADLDAPGLARTLCAPLRRPGATNSSQRIFGTYAYERPYAAWPASGGTRLMTQRCGSPARTLRKCDGGCLDIEVNGGVLTWTEARSIYAVQLATGQVTRWTSKAGRPVATHVGRTVFMSLPTANPTVFKTYRSRLG